MNVSPDIEKTEYSKVLTEEPEEECKDPPQCKEGWKSFLLTFAYSDPFSMTWSQTSLVASDCGGRMDQSDAWLF